MKQAKPTAAECAAFLRFMQGLESIIESVESPDGSEIDVHDNAECMEWIESQWRTIGPIWQRVYWAGRRASRTPAIRRRRRWSGGKS